MWIAGDAIMFVLMMVVVVMWSTDTRAESRTRGWLEATRRAVVAPTAVATNADIDEDDDQLAAYNAYLRDLNEGRRHQAG
jgi:hypothetical protein